MATTEHPAENRYITVRLRLEDEYEALKAVATDEFEGNLSMAVRRAIRAFLQTHEPVDRKSEVSTCTQ